MPTAIRALHVSKEYMLGVFNYEFFYKDMQSWIARRFGKVDPHSKLDAEVRGHDSRHFWALKDISFDLEQGERLGVIGVNGSGKSTLLKIFSRITAPTEGEIRIRGRTASLLEVGTGFHPELTGRENVYLNGAILGMKKREISRKLDEIIDFSEIEQFIDTPVKRYSSGMYVRLAFAVASTLESDILIADEVLAVGDMGFQAKALKKMNDVSKEQGRTIIYVSHALATIQTLCNRCLLLSKGHMLQLGTTDEVVAKYTEMVNLPK
jgi:lipopolysaccharide transport system ATP-binding protein